MRRCAVELTGKKLSQTFDNAQKDGLNIYVQKASGVIAMTSGAEGHPLEQGLFAVDCRRQVRPHPICTREPQPATCSPIAGTCLLTLRQSRVRGLWRLSLFLSLAVGGIHVNQHCLPVDGLIESLRGARAIGMLGRVLFENLRLFLGTLCLTLPVAAELVVDQFDTPPGRPDGCADRA